MRALGRALAAVTLAMGPAHADEPEWRTFRVEGGGFEVEIHGAPEHLRRREGTLLGRVTHDYYWVDRAGARLEIERHELPSLAPTFLSDEALLDRAQAGLIEQVGVAPTIEEPLELQGYPGRRVVYYRGEPEPSPEETRFYLVGRILFLVATGAYQPETREPIVDRFFDSFRIVESELK